MRFSFRVLSVVAATLAGIQVHGGPKSVNMAKAPPPLRILLNTSGIAPYAENASGEVLSAFNAAVLGQLLKTDENFDLKPGLLESWTWDYKDSSYTLTLRPTRFHNGREVTASDLEFSLLRGFYSKQRSFYRVYLANIEGLDAAERAQRYSSGVVSGIKITGPRSIRVKLSEPNPSFLHSLVNPYFSLVPIEEFNSDYMTWKSVPIGAGPYRVARGFENGKVVLEAFDSANSRIPELVELYTTPPQTDLDASLNNDPSLAGMNLERELTRYPIGVVTIFFSNRNPLAAHSSFRHAVAHAVNRQALADGLDAYSPTLELLPKHFWGRAGLKEIYSPEKARAFFNQVPKDLRSRTWRVPVFSGRTFTPDYHEIFRRLSGQLAAIGLKVEFYPSTEKFISEETALASPLSISGRVTDYVDPLIMFASFRFGSAYVFEREESDQKFEELYKQAASSQAREERIQTIQTLSSYVNDRVLAVPLLERRLARYYNPKAITSFGDQPQPLTLFIDRMQLTGN